MQELNERLGLSHGIAHGRRPTAYAVYANAQFGVSRDRMLSRPLHLYEALLREFDKQPSAQCFLVGGPKGRPHRGTCALLEYTWHTIMGEPPILDPRLTMSGKVAVQFRPGAIEHDPTLQGAGRMSPAAAARARIA